MPTILTPRLHRPRGTSSSERTRRMPRSEEHTSELQSLAYLVCRLLLEKKKQLDRKLYPQSLGTKDATEDALRSISGRILEPPLHFAHLDTAHPPSPVLTLCRPVSTPPL